MTIWTIDAPHMCAGIQTNESGVVVAAAPIVKYMQRKRWSLEEVADYCRIKGWGLYRYDPATGKTKPFDRADIVSA